MAKKDSRPTTTSITRRQLGGAATAASLLTACGTDVDEDVVDEPDKEDPIPEPGPEPDLAWVAPGAEDLAAFPSGLRVGDALPTSAIVSCRSTEPTLTLRVAVGTEDGWEELEPVVNITVGNGVAQFELENLQADHAYSLAFYAADGSRRSRASRFRTALDPRGNRIVRFGATSCLGGNEPWPTLSHAAGQRLDFFLMGGDTIYADWGFNVFDFELKWEQANGVPGLQDLASSTSLIGTWDDHEVDNNWSWNSAGIETRVDAAMLAFRRGMPQRIGPGGTGIWRQLNWGKTLDVFVLDSRGERRDGNYVSAEQLTWLMEGLSASTARFKVILNSVPIIDFSGTLVEQTEAQDRWQGFPAQRSQLISHIVDQPIEGVLFISGDFHIGGVATVDPEDAPGAGLIEVLAGPGGSPINMFANLIQPGPRLLSVVKVWNYVLFEADPEKGTIVLRFIADDATVIEELELQL